MATISVVLPREFSTLTRPGPAQRPPALHVDFNLILAKQKLDSFRVFVNNFLLTRQRRRPVEREFLHVNAEFALAFLSVS